MTISDPLPPDSINCSFCRNIISKKVRYCPYCGNYQNYWYEQSLQERNEKKWEIIKGVIVFYTIYLTSVLPLYWLPNDQVAGGMVIISFIDIFIILGYKYHTRIALLPLFRSGKSILNYLLAGTLILVPVMFLNFLYHDFLEKLFNIEKINLSTPFLMSGYSFGMMVFTTCLMPALWEEIAFRGLIQTGFSRILNKREAILLTSTLFAIIHAAVLSWPYLFILGIFLGVLRLGSQSLWPCIVVHFIHNFVVMYNEVYGGIF